MIAIDFNKLIHSVTYYLSYQDRIGREFMINESSLKYPVADYLTGLEIPLVNIQLEYAHPDLKKRQIDLITTDISKRVESAYEFKIARQITKYESEQKRIFNDLMRLHLIGRSNGAACYFIIAGTQSDFIQYFRSIVTKKPDPNNKNLPMPEGFYSEWFDFEIGEEKTFFVRDCSDDTYAAVYTAFWGNYESRKKNIPLVLPEKLTTTCVAISAISREFPTPFVGGIWKVE
jgi:hypothetical protein